MYNWKSGQIRLLLVDDADEERIVIFATDEGLQHLSKSNEWVYEWTFCLETYRVYAALCNKNKNEWYFCYGRLLLAHKKNPVYL